MGGSIGAIKSDADSDDHEGDEAGDQQRKPGILENSPQLPVAAQPDKQNKFPFV